MPSNNTPSNISGNVFGIESNQLKRTVKGLNDSFTYTKNISDNIRNISDDTENLYNNSKKLYNNSDIDIKQDRAFYKAQLQWNAESKNLLREIKNTIIASSTKDEANIEKSFNKFKKQLEDDNKKDLESNEKVIKELESIGLNIKENEKKEEKRHKNNEDAQKKINETIEEGFNAYQEANRKNIQQSQEIYQILESQNKLLSKATKDMNHHYLLRGTWTEKLYNGVIGIKREFTDSIKDVKGFFKAGGNVALLAIEKGIEKLIEVVKGIGDEIVKRTEEQLNILRERSAQTAKDYQIDYNTARLLESSNMKFFSRMNESLGAGASAYAEKTAADIFNRFTSKRQMMSREKQVKYQEGFLMGNEDLLMDSGMFKTRDAAKKFARVSQEISAQLNLATKLANDQGMNNSLNYIHEMIDSAGGNPDKLMELSPAILSEIDMLKRMSQADKATREAYDQKKSLSQTLAEIKDNDAYSGMTEEQKYKLVAKRTAEYALTSSRLSGPGKSIIEAFYDANAEMLRSRMPELATKPEYISQLKTFGGDELYKAFREGDVEKALNIIRKNSLTKDLSGFSTVLNEITGMSMDAGTWKGGLKQINDQFENVQSAISEFYKIDLTEADKNIMGTASRLEELTASDKSLDTMIVGQVDKLNEIEKKIREDNKGLPEADLDKKIKEAFLKEITADQNLVNNIKKFGFMDEKGNLNEDQFYTRVKFGNISKNFTEIGEQVPTSLTGAMDTLFRLATKATINPEWNIELEKITSSLKPLFETFGDILAKDVFPKLADPLQEVIKGALGAVFGLGNTVFTNLPAFIKGIVDAANSATEGAVTAITDEAKELGEKYKEFKNNLNEFILDPLKQFWDDKVIPFWNDKVIPALDGLIDRVIKNMPIIGTQSKNKSDLRDILDSAGLDYAKKTLSNATGLEDDLKKILNTKELQTFQNLVRQQSSLFKSPDEIIDAIKSVENNSDIYEKIYKSEKFSDEQKNAFQRIFNTWFPLGDTIFGSSDKWKQENRELFYEMIRNEFNKESDAKLIKTAPGRRYNDEDIPMDFLPTAASGGLFKRVEGGRIIKIAEGDGDEIVLPLSRTQRDNAMNLLQIAKDKYGLPIEILGDKNKGIDINRENLSSYINTQLNYVSDQEAIKAYKEAKQILKNSIITLGQGKKESSIGLPTLGDIKNDTNLTNNSKEYKEALEKLNNWEGGKTPPKEFIALLGPILREDMRVTGIPASVSLAQAIIETGWGGSAKKTNTNLFGIKGKGNAGSINSGTHEIYDGVEVNKKANFAKYHSFLDSIKAHSDYLLTTKSSSKGLRGLLYGEALTHIFEPNLFAFLLKEAGYATSENYGSKLADLMRTHNLYKWDTPYVNIKNVGQVQKELISQSKYNLENPEKSNQRLAQLMALEEERVKNYNSKNTKQRTVIKGITAQDGYNPNNKYVIDTETDPLLETIPNISEASAQEIKTQSFSKLQEGFERIKTIMSPSNTKSNSAKSKETLQVIKEISSQIGEIAKYAYSMAKQPVQSKAVNYSSFGTNNHYVNTEAYS